MIAEVQLNLRVGSHVAWAPGAVPLLAFEARQHGSTTASVCVLHPGCPEVRWTQILLRSAALHEHKSVCSQNLDAC